MRPLQRGAAPRAPGPLRGFDMQTPIMAGPRKPSPTYGRSTRRLTSTEEEDVLQPAPQQPRTWRQVQARSAAELARILDRLQDSSRSSTPRRDGSIERAAPTASRSRASRRPGSRPPGGETEHRRQPRYRQGLHASGHGPAQRAVKEMSSRRRPRGPGNAARTTTVASAALPGRTAASPMRRPPWPPPWEKRLHGARLRLRPRIGPGDVELDRDPEPARGAAGGHGRSGAAGSPGRRLRSHRPAALRPRPAHSRRREQPVGGALARGNPAHAINRRGASPARRRCRRPPCSRRGFFDGVLFVAGTTRGAAGGALSGTQHAIAARLKEEPVPMGSAEELSSTPRDAPVAR